MKKVQNEVKNIGGFIEALALGQLPQYFPISEYEANSINFICNGRFDRTGLLACLNRINRMDVTILTTSLRPIFTVTLV